MNNAANSPLSKARLVLRQNKHEGENKMAASMLADFPLSQSELDSIVETAHAIVTKSREMSAERGTLDAFMQEFGLSNQEGVALMCLAEALLRIPNAETQDALIAEKIASGNWADHRGSSQDLFVNAGVWALMLTGGVIKLDENVTRDAAGWTKSAVARLSGPVIRKAVMQAMRIMGHQFVFGRTIKEALKHREKRDAGNRLFSFDMLGEGARTAADAERHQSLYRQVIGEVGKAIKDEGDDIANRSSVSIKLSALHPRYEAIKQHRVMTELLPKVKELALLARTHNMQLTIDAEEADRLDISLDLFEALARDPDLSGWQGLGLVVQAYQKRGPALIDWLSRWPGKQAGISRPGWSRVPTGIPRSNTPRKWVWTITRFGHARSPPISATLNVPDACSRHHGPSILNLPRIMHIHSPQWQPWAKAK